MTARNSGSQSQLTGQNSAIEVLKMFEETAFQIVFTAFFGSTLNDGYFSLEDLLEEFREVFSISSGSAAQVEMAWETILPSHLFFGLVPVDDIRKTEQSLKGIKSFCRKQIAQRKSEVRTTQLQQCDTALCYHCGCSGIANFVFSVYACISHSS